MSAPTKIPETNKYLEFIKRHHPGYKVNWHHNVQSWYLNEWVEGRLPYQIHEVPPQYGKTTTAAVKKIAHIFKKYPTARIAYCTYNQDRANEVSEEAKAVMQTEAYQEECNGLTVPQGETNLKKWRNTLGGSIKFVGRGGALTGSPVDFLIIDDLYKDEKEASSPVVRERTWQWFIKVAMTRLSPDARVIMFFTRWDDDDVIGRITRLQEKHPEIDLAWERLSFPALMTRELYEIKHPADPRKPGEALWEWKHTAKQLKSLEVLMGKAAFDALYQQIPPNQAGGKIKLAWLKRGNRSDIPANTRWYRFYRFGELEKMTVDKDNATLLVAKTRNKDILIKDLKKFDGQWAEATEQMRYTAERESGIKVGLKDAGGSKSELVDQVIENKPKGRSVKAYPTVDPLNWTADARAGKIILIEDENTDEFIEHCKFYTGTGKDKHEATIQAVAGAYGMIRAQKSVTQILAAKNRKPKRKKRRMLQWPN